MGKAFYSQVFGLVVGKAKVVLRRQQSVFGLLQMIDGFVDFVYGGLELSAGKIVVAGKTFLEVVDVVFKVGYINILSTN